MRKVKLSELPEYERDWIKIIGHGERSNRLIAEKLWRRKFPPSPYEKASEIILKKEREGKLKVTKVLLKLPRGYKLTYTRFIPKDVKKKLRKVY